MLPGDENKRRDNFHEQEEEMREPARPRGLKRKVSPALRRCSVDLSYP